MKKIIIIIWVTLFPLNLLGWSSFSHEVITAVAFEKINNETKKKLTILLNSPKSLYNELLRYSTFADKIKYIKNIPANYEKYTDTHFINIPIYINPNKSVIFDHTTSKQLFLVQLKQYLRNSHSYSSYDLCSAIRLAIQTISNPLETNKQKIFELKMLIHLEEDAHQPLHVGNPVIVGKNYKFDTKGGNLVRIHNLMLKYDGHYKKIKNLHSLLDSINNYDTPYHQLYRANISSIAHHIILTYDPQSTLQARAQDLKISDWLYDSYHNAELISQRIKYYSKNDHHYYVKAVISKKNITYISNQNTEAIYIAGVRLANLLNKNIN